MSAPVEAKFVPPSIEPDAAPTMTESKLLNNIAAFVEGLSHVETKEALEAYWKYKDGIFKKALDTYAAIAVFPGRFAGTGRHCHYALNIYSKEISALTWELLASDAKAIMELMVPRLDETNERRLLRLIILLYANDRVQTKNITNESNQAPQLPGEALRQSLTSFSERWEAGRDRWDVYGVLNRSVLGLWWEACDKEKLWETLCLHKAPVEVVARLSMQQQQRVDDAAGCFSSGQGINLHEPGKTESQSEDEQSTETEKRKSESNEHRSGLRTVFEAMQYLQATKGQDSARLTGYFQDVSALRSYTPDRYEEMLEKLCQSAASRLQAWSEESNGSLLPTLAEAESWAVVTRKHCLEVAGGRMTLKAAMALVERVVTLCCQGSGRVSNKRDEQLIPSATATKGMYPLAKRRALCALDD